MYFLAHLFVILKTIPYELEKDEIITELLPMIHGSWGPDLGYFSFFSPKLKLFGHAENPQLNFYQGEKVKEEAFIKGWKMHMICDEMIHKEPFFENGEPICPLIKRNEGFITYLRTAREHLGREVGLDVLIFKEILSNDWIGKTILNKQIYLEGRIPYPGFKKVQKYVVWYTTKFIPAIADNKGMGKRILKIIKYGFYNETIEEKVKEMLEKMTIKCKEIIAI